MPGRRRRHPPSDRPPCRAGMGLAEELAGRAAGHLAEASQALAAHPDIRYAGFVHDAAKEYAEARLTLAFVRGDPLPQAPELGVEVQAFLNGMAEAASE